MATVSISLPLGYDPYEIRDMIKPYISMCGMYLHVRVQWPNILEEILRVCGKAGRVIIVLIPVYASTC
jgi:hypothetical protein